MNILIGKMNIGKSRAEVGDNRLVAIASGSLSGRERAFGPFRRHDAVQQVCVARIQHRIELAGERFICSISAAMRMCFPFKHTDQITLYSSTGMIGPVHIHKFREHCRLGRPAGKPWQPA